MPGVICNNPAEWDAYRAAHAINVRAEAAPADLDVRFSENVCPASYPVLVVLTLAMVNEAERCVVCVPVLVHVPDARALMTAAAAPPLPATTTAHTTTVLNTVGATQAETNRHVAALALVVCRFLAAQPGWNPTRVERELAETLAHVDRFEATRNEDILKVVDFAALLLPKLVPPPDAGE